MELFIRSFDPTKDRSPKFKVGDSVWVCPNNTPTGWYLGIVVHILPHDQPLQNGQKPGLENLYIVEIPNHVESYFDMFTSGRLHSKKYCKKNSAFCGEHDCVFDAEAALTELQVELDNVVRLRSQAGEHVRKHKERIKALQDRIKELKTQIQIEKVYDGTKADNQDS